MYQTETERDRTFYIQPLKIQTNMECLHKQCPECNGTGIKQNRQPCNHWMHCPCPRCNPQTHKV